MLDLQAQLQKALGYQQRGDLARARKLYQKLLKAAPHAADVRFKFASLQFNSGQYSDAIKQLKRTLELAPSLAEAQDLLGQAYLRSGQQAKAVAAFEKAIALKPSLASPHYNLALALMGQGDPERCRLLLETACRLVPQRLEPRYNLGNLHMSCGRFDLAMAAYQEVLRLNPHFLPALHNLATVQLSSGRPEDALQSYRQALAINPDEEAVRVNYAVVHNYIPGLSCQQVAQAHREVGQVLTERALNSIPNGYAGAGRASPDDGRLRVGYLSPDFRNHPVGTFMEPVLRYADRETFEVFCYYNHATLDATSERLRELADHWHQVDRLTDPQLAELILAHRIDILVDLAGYTEGFRLGVFARRVAPMQINYLGYPMTSGVATMDYRITDAVADPVGQDDPHYTEQMLRLPGAFFCYQPPEEAPDIVPSPALRGNPLTFGSFNGPLKLNDACFRLYASVLRAVPGSRLLLQGNGMDSVAVEQRLHKLLAAEGVDSDRLMLRGKLPFGEYLAAHGEVDLILDPLPWNGHTTSCHALWMGVPVLTLRGQTHCGRMGASLLTHCGLGELIADTKQAYVEKAVQLAGSVEGLDALRQGMRERFAQSGLTDGRRFTRHLEQLYQQAWQQRASESE